MTTQRLADRTLYELSMEPSAGSRFQPTGFPDLGAAIFQKPDGRGGWVDALLVESPQSMANWLERTTWDEAANAQVPTLNGLPYLNVVDQEHTFLTSTRLEAHRLACAYVMEGTVNGESRGEDWLEARFGLTKGRPLDSRALAREICSLDPLSLVHGVFFARKPWPWQPKIARAVTAFIEAYDVRAANSGGVKKDSVDPSGENTETGYGMVPHQRTEYTARAIKAMVSVDHGQFRSYGLGDDGVELLEAIVEYQIAQLFAEPLRLRTACDLAVIDTHGADLPEVDSATRRVEAAIQAGRGLLGPVLNVEWSGRAKAKVKA